MKKLLIAVALCLLCGSAYGQISLLAISVPTTFNFDSFDGGGFVPGGTLTGEEDSNTFSFTGFSDGDLAFGDMETSGDFARGLTTGGVSTGGIYAFDLGGGNRALGIQPGGSDFTPGTMVIALRNDSGDMISEIDVSYDIIVFNDQARANTFNFGHGAIASGPFTPEPTLNFTSPEAADGAPAFVTTNRNITLSGLNIPNGGDYFLEFSSDDSTGSGARDEIGIDNITVTPTAVPVELQRFEIE